MKNPQLPVVTAAGLLALLPALVAGADVAPPRPTADTFFESKIRPVLATQCGSCHGAGKQLSGLRLDTRVGLLKGGARGPSVVPGKPDQSLLIAAVRYGHATLKMPPGGKLVDQQIRDLEEWVRSGAPFPAVSAGRPDRPELDVELGRSFWAFRPPARPPLPRVRDVAWVRTPIDAFILAGLEKAGLRPSPPADRDTLLRRATYDLTGLPPTPEEREAFLRDRSPNAWEKVIDRLLASPAYGEKWGRHWLDVARYADSNGLDENVAYAHAFRYRDYVVRALNQDKPFDRFLQEQLAGDLLPETDPAARNDRLTATGFLTVGPKVLSEVDDKKMEMDIVDEQIDTVGRAFMGLTLGCARCHDHKFDPIKTEDYYALAGIFKSTRTMDKFTKPSQWHENLLGSPEEVARRAAADKRAAELQEQLKSVTNAANAQLKKSLAGKALPAMPESAYPAETRERLRVLREELAKVEAAAPALEAAMGVAEASPVNVAVHIRGNYLTLGAVVDRRFPLVLAGKTQPPVAPSASGRLELARWLTDGNHPLTGRVIVNRVWRWHFGEGIVRTTDNFGHLGELPANQPLLDWLATAFVAPAAVPGSTTPARFNGNPGALTPSPLNALPSGAAATPPSGAAGTPPSGAAGTPYPGPRTPYPGAAATPAPGMAWSLKALHRMIMLSNTYQMSSGDSAQRSVVGAQQAATRGRGPGFGDRRATSEAAHRAPNPQSAIRIPQSGNPKSAIRNPQSVDPENRLHWRHDLRRLEAEEIRDSLLAVSGTLDRTMGGTLLPLKNREYVFDHTSTDHTKYDFNRRALYLPVIRNHVYDVFQLFDFPDPAVETGSRSTTTVATQSLFFLNSDLVAQASEDLAAGLLRHSEWGEPERVNALYRKVYCRLPSAQESRWAQDALQRFRGLAPAGAGSPPDRERRAWSWLCHTLFAANEFVYIR